ncbi:MAG: FkbM family methyltransferase [Desulfovibrionaceae bacterium]|nr:FkbM family methyltransferase [Desulfovibrionaceae bacterium]
MKTIDDILSLCTKNLNGLTNYVQTLILQHAREIETSLSLFSDDESKYLYAQEIIYTTISQFVYPVYANHIAGLMPIQEFMAEVEKVKKHKIFELFLAPNKQENTEMIAVDLTGTFIFEQYKYKDIVLVQEGDVVIDGGGFIGDTAIYFARNGAKDIYTFECDRENVVALEKNIKNFQCENQIHVCEYALSQKVGSMYYEKNQGNISGGALVNEATKDSIEIKATSIDAFCEEQSIQPNFIKMDIEGAELDALLGTKETIKKYKPRLAICIYHKESHRWEIPLFVHEVMPEYRLYLNRQNPYGETVLFAI